MMLIFFNKIKRYLFFLFGVSVIFFLGYYFVIQVGKNEEDRIRNEMFAFTQTYANIFDAQKYKNLQADLADKESLDYKEIKEKLISIANTNKTLGVRWIYTMVPRDGQIVFSVDSIPLDSPDYTDPGDIYTDASVNLIEAVYKAWTSGVSSITEPYTDQWGNFITTIVPIRNINTNEIVSVLASDVDYILFYKHRINEAKMVPFIVTILGLVLYTLIFIYILFLLKDKREILNKNIVLKQYVEHVPGMFYQYQIFPNGKKIMPYVSKNIWNFFEVTKEEVAKDVSKLFSHINKSDLDGLNNSIKESMDTMKEWDFEFRVDLSNGIKWLRGKASPNKESDGSILWYGYILDITEDKEKELELEKRAVRIKDEMFELEKVNEKLKENRESMLTLVNEMSDTQKKLELDHLRTDTIISSMGEGLIIINKEYIVKLINPRALEFIGYEENEVLGKDFRTIVKLIKNKKELTASDWPTEKTFSTNQITTTSIEDDILINSDRQKDPLAVTFSIAPISSKLEHDPNKVGLVILVRDANRDRELDAVKSGFISAASHQLRTPLTTIRWYSEMLLSGAYGIVGEQQRDLLKEINDGVNRLHGTINLLLGISRVENGKVFNTKAPIDLTKITTEVIKELSRNFDQKKLAYFSFSAQTDPIIVIVDPVALRQVILNLFVNASLYTRENGTIEGRWLIDKDKKEVVYSVRDNGIGIPKDAQSRIFSKFFRAENAVLKVPDGTGLGLAFIKDIVVSWGGRVWFETEEGKGTTFFFTIPIVEN